MLSVTLDNASNNEAMVRELGKLLKSFTDLCNMIRCFPHTLNLGARSLMHQFDVAKTKGDSVLSEAERALRDLMKAIEMSQLDFDDEEEEDEGWNEGDDEDGLVDPRQTMTEVKVEELEELLMPARLVLTKLSYSLINSPLIALPAWCDALRAE
ncbi:hypothetical protein EIP86_011091 [Pleurotus ostreatoroseus]|nr:hypothetical protein EIP86_011091 [Pleurotus ostreatoroseus]